jgi:Rieske 2Fe-2S family protein
MPASSLADFRQSLAATRRDFPQALTLPGPAYTSDEVFAAERREIFARSWTCVARATDVPAAGDHVVVDVTGDSVLLLRGADGVLRAFYNVCRHRGSRLVLEACGQGATRLLCPYHAWSYQIDGSLGGAPQMPASFRREDHGLLPVRMEIFHGFVFVNLDADAPPLAVQFAQLPNLDRYRMGELVRGPRFEYDVAANWKLICENYSECYHCPSAHPQLARLTELIGRSERAIEAGDCFNGGPMRLRDGIETMSGSGRSPLTGIAGLSDAEARLVNYYVIYPTLLLSPHPDYVMVHLLWPLAPDRTRVVCDFLVGAADAARSADELADVTTFWDVTNRQDWQLCERVQAAAGSRGFLPGPYQTSEDCVHTFDRWYADRMANAT